MTKRNVVIAALILGVISLPLTAFLALQLRDTPAKAADEAGGAAVEGAAGSKGGDGDGADGEGEKKPFEALEMRSFLIPIIEDSGTDSYLSMRVQVQVRAGKPAAEDKKAMLRDRIITRLYDLDTSFSLEQKKDVERIRKAVRGAAVDVYGQRRVGAVLFKNLVQQDMAG
jgi:flagellar basal body-associated protein FliL